jgi:3-hydroxyisobutyrate dehydrogenase-like beta-hydroxyacid dehydrogenase
VLSGAQGLLSAPKRSSVVAVCSTISVAAVLSDEADEPDRYLEAVAFAALARKDLRAASELARELGVAAPVANLAEDLADFYFGVAPRT